jgi:hypothetical protein
VAWNTVQVSVTSLERSEHYLSQVRKGGPESFDGYSDEYSTMQNAVNIP